MSDTMCNCISPWIADPLHKKCIVPSNYSPQSGKNDGTASCKNEQVPRGNPVNAGTGLKFQVEVDYRGPSGLEFRRVYNSRTAYETPWSTIFGQDVSLKHDWNSGWRHNWSRSIKATTQRPPEYPLTNLPTDVYRSPPAPTRSTVKTAYVERGDGKTYTFTFDGSVWGIDGDVKDQLTAQFFDSGYISGWTYATEDQEVEQYDASGKLTSITDRYGRTTSLTYSKGDVCSCFVANGTTFDGALPPGYLIGITDHYGRTIRFGYDIFYRIGKMTDAAGKDYFYMYDGTNGELASVTYPDGTTRQYLYENTTHLHALTGIIDENGARYATYDYDSAGRAISTEHANGVDKVTFRYNSDGTTSITDNYTDTNPSGTSRTQSLRTVLGVVKNGGANQPSGSGCGASTSGISYDINGNVASRTDFNGYKTCYAYDLARNLETKRIEGLPTTADCASALASPPTPTRANPVRIITTKWHSTLRLPAAFAEPLRKTSYIYNGDIVAGQAVTCGVRADGTPVPGVLCSQTIEVTTDTNGATGLGAVRASNTMPRIFSYTYNSSGQVLTLNGPRTDVSDITAFEYDANGNLTAVTNALNQTTTLGNYDANGRPGSITDPNGLVTSFYYDLRGRLTSRSAGTESISYTYDGVGQLNTVSTPGGATYTYSYDDAHRLTDITDNLGNRLHYTLDAMGNRIKDEVRDSNGNIVQSHSRKFDALNRLWQDIGAVNQTTTYEYDPNGNLTKIIVPFTSTTNRTTINSYDALNRLMRIDNPDNGVIQYAYDGLDQLTGVTDPKNNLTSYDRDGFGNLVRQNSPDTGSTINTYDEAGNLKTRTDAKGQIATYTYDALNRVTNISYTDPKAPARNQSVSYQYDQGDNCTYCIGHLTRITDATGITGYSYDEHGRLTGETRQPTAGGISYTTSYRYDSNGRLDRITYPSGRTVDYRFDTLGRINQVTTTFNGVAMVLASNITYEPFGGVHSYVYSDGSPTARTYTRERDQDGRIASYTLNGQARYINYDAASQINSISGGTDPVANYSYDAMGRLTDYFTDMPIQSFEYDAVGNRTTATIGSTLSTYGYSATSNRLANIKVGTGSVAQSIAHDDIGSITSDPTKQHTYVHDIRGRLQSAATAQGVINFEVNALGLRVRKHVPSAGTDTLYHYDSLGHLIAENENGSSRYAREYIYLGDLPLAVMK